MHRLIVVVGLLIIALYFAASFFLQPVDDRFNYHEAAVLSMRQILRAQDAYAANHPKKSFAATLTDLGPTPGAGLIDAELARGRGRRYGFALAPGPVDASGRIATYSLTADPTEQRFYSFFADESTVVRRSSDRGIPASISDLPFAEGLVQDGLIGFAPDGKSVAVILGVGVRLLDVTTGREIDRLPTPAERVSIGFGPDGKLLAWRISEKAELWDLRSGREAFSLDSSTQTRPVAFSTDGRWLACTGQNEEIQLWDVAAKKPLRTFKTDADFRIEKVSFSADSRLVFATGLEGTTSAGSWRPTGSTARFWDVATGQDAGTVRSAEPIGVYALSPDGMRFAAKGGSSVPARIWDSSSGMLLQVLRHSPSSSRVSFVSFRADGNVAATGGEDGMIKLWDANSGSELHVVPDRFGLARGGFAAAGPLLYINNPESIMLWDTAATNGWQLQMPHDHFHARSFAFSSDGGTIAAAGDFAVGMWEVITGKVIRTLAQQYTEVTFSPDGRLLGITERAGAVEVSDVLSGTQLHTIVISPDNNAGRLVFSPGQRWLAGKDVRGPTRIWDVATGQEVHRIEMRPGTSYPSPAAISSDGRFLAVFEEPASGATFQVWDLQTNSPLGVGLVKAGNRETSLSQNIALSPDGRKIMLAVQDSGETYSVWDVATGRTLYTFPADSGPLVFSSDSRLIAHAGNDRLVQLWNALSGEKLSLLNHRDAIERISSMAFSPDGLWLATSGDYGRLSIWNLETATFQATHSLIPMQ